MGILVNPSLGLETLWLRRVWLTARGRTSAGIRMQVWCRPSGVTYTVPPPPMNILGAKYLKHFLHFFSTFSLLLGILVARSFIVQWGWDIRGGEILLSNSTPHWLPLRSTPEPRIPHVWNGTSATSPVHLMCVPGDRIHMGKLGEVQGAEQTEGRSARGGTSNRFLGRAFSTGSGFTAESSKVQLFKGANWLEEMIAFSGFA